MLKCSSPSHPLLALYESQPLRQGDVGSYVLQILVLVEILHLRHFLRISLRKASLSHCTIRSPVLPWVANCIFVVRRKSVLVPSMQASSVMSAVSHGDWFSAFSGRQLHANLQHAKPAVVLVVNLEQFALGRALDAVYQA